MPFGLAVVSMIVTAFANCDEDECDSAVLPGKDGRYTDDSRLTGSHRPVLFFILVFLVLWSCMMFAAGWKIRSRVLKAQAAHRPNAPSVHESCQVDLESLSRFPSQAQVCITKNGECYHSSGCHTLKGELKVYRACNWCIERANDIKKK